LSGACSISAGPRTNLTLHIGRMQSMGNALRCSFRGGRGLKAHARQPADRHRFG
jgi:hypothetical protein